MNISFTDKRTILFTGGHVTPAVATIEHIRAAYPQWHIVFVGRKVAMEGSRTISEEYRLMQAMNIRFFALIAGRFKRDGGVGAVVSLLKVPVGLLQSIWYVWRIRPDVIVSFGGYVALPVVSAGWLLRVPVVTHEQTTRPGLANRIIARFSAYTCVSFPDASAEKGLSGRVIHTGLPIRASVFTPPKTPPFEIPDPKRPILFFVGGSTGAMSVNTVVYHALPELLKTYTVIHQVGRISISKAQEVKSALSKQSEHYIPVPYLSEASYAWGLHHADVIVGRSGANTVMEIAAVGGIAVCIPLPWAAANEQYHNAEFLESAGSAVILPQDTLTPEKLVLAVSKMIADRKSYSQAARRLAEHVPHDGARRLTDVIARAVAPR